MEFKVIVPSVAYVSISESVEFNQAGCDYINALPLDGRDSAVKEAWNNPAFCDSSFTWRVDFTGGSSLFSSPRTFRNKDAAAKDARKMLRKHGDAIREELR